MKHSAIAILMFVMFSSKAGAQGPPVFSDSPVLLGMQGSAIRTYALLSSFNDAKVYSQVLGIPYNITSDLAVSVSVPYLNIKIPEIPSSGGIGDVSSSIKYVFQRKDEPMKTSRMAGKLTTVFPTGDDSKVPPLGSGKLSMDASLVAAFINLQYGLYGEAGYQFLNAANGIIHYNLALGIPLLPQNYPPQQLNIYIEAFGESDVKTAQDKFYAAPGLQYIAGRRLLLEAGVKIPVYEDVPSKNKMNYSLLTGLRVLLN